VVFDVGRFGDQVFVAMELVDGETLRGWLAKGQTWREVVAMFRQAGDGIAAAHAAGLVHRDIKPDNVLVGRDGRARVTDFGLARIGAAEGDGSIVGTPGYMAPEQLRGGTVDARSDQFGFCVALFEGLHGERPFDGATSAAIEAGPRAGKARIPRWLRRIVERGLAADPAQRYPSMADLLADVSVDRRARWRRIAVVAACAAIAVIVYALRGSSEPPPCGSSAAKIDTVWNATSRAAIAHAFRASGRPFAEQTLVQVDGALDRYAGRWRALRTDACEATYVRHEQSAELLDRRDACLEERRAALGAQVQLFESADASLVDRAARLATDLPSLEPCSDTTALLALVPPPADLARRLQIEPLRGRLGAASVLERDAHYPETRAAIAALRGPVDALHYAPLVANLDELEGALAEDQHDTKGAMAAFDRAALEAEAGGDDLSKARALLGGGRVRGMANVEPEMVARLLDQAKAALARVGGAPDIAVRLELAYGAIALVKGAFAEVVPHDRAALAIAERAYGDDFRTASIRGELALALERVAKYDEAGKLAVRAVDVLVKQLGPTHPRTILARGTWAQVLFDQAKYDEALAQQQQVLAAQQQVFGADYTGAWRTFSDMARTYEAKADFAQALALFERAQGLVERELGANHPNAVLLRVNVASALLELKRFDESVAAFRDAIARSVAAVGPDNIFMANAQNGIAQAWRASHPREALVAAEDALRLFRKLEGDDHPDVGRGYDTLGRVLDTLGRTADAQAALERAVATREKVFGADHPDTADSRFALAELLDRTGKRARAIELAIAAKHAFVAIGDAENTKEIETWLAARGR